MLLQFRQHRYVAMHRLVAAELGQRASSTGVIYRYGGTRGTGTPTFWTAGYRIPTFQDIGDEFESADLKPFSARALSRAPLMSRLAIQGRLIFPS